MYVYNEFVEENQRLILDKLINCNKLSIDTFALFENTVNLFNTYPSLSFSDSSLLELALRIKAILLTADKNLRTIAEKNGIEVKGLLWIIFNMYQQEVISSEIAIEKLEKYPLINVRAPIKEAKNLINQINKSKM
jgi:predicted nucleic acid-binding protein